MLTYQYECHACHRQHEIQQRITAKPLRTCPACGGRMRRLVGMGLGVIFKGSGFYSTDYRSAAYTKRAAEEKPKAGGASGGGSAAAPPPPTRDSTAKRADA